MRKTAWTVMLLLVTLGGLFWIDACSVYLKTAEPTMTWLEPTPAPLSRLTVHVLDSKTHKPIKGARTLAIAGQTPYPLDCCGWGLMLPLANKPAPSELHPVDARGRFTAEIALSRGGLVYILYGGGARLTKHAIPPSPTGKPVEIEVAIDTGGTATFGGQVFGHRGAPLPNAAVSTRSSLFYSYSAPEMPKAIGIRDITHGETTTSTDGAFEVTLPKHSLGISLVIEHPDHAAMSWHPVCTCSEAQANIILPASASLDVTYSDSRASFYDPVRLEVHAGLQPSSSASVRPTIVRTTIPTGRSYTFDPVPSLLPINLKAFSGTTLLWEGQYEPLSPQESRKLVISLP